MGTNFFKKSISTQNIFILTLLILLCPTFCIGQNYKQEILFTNSLDSVNLSWEFGSEVISGSRKININKLNRPIQIKAEKRGYKTEYIGLVNNRENKYKKEVEIKFDRKVPLYDKTKKNILLKEVDTKFASLEFETIPVENEDFGENRSNNYEIDYFKRNIVTIYNKKAHEKILSFLTEWGYVDTIGSLLKVSDTQANAEVKIKKSKYYLYLLRNGWSDEYRMVCELTVEWKFYDEYNQLKHTQELITRSGQFVPMKLTKERMEGPNEVAERAASDALCNSFVDLVNSEQGKKWITDIKKANDKPTFDLLNLKKVSCPVDLKTAIKSTIAVTTKDGFGSGFIVSGDGYIVTNYHVIAGQDSSVKVLLSENDSMIARVVRYSEIADIALLKIDRTFNYMILLDPSVETSLVDEVFAIGNPISIELGQTVSKGIISGFRKNSAGVNIIQTDVSVNPGNSGGPLLLPNGKLVGVVNSKISGLGIEGVGFSISVDDVLKLLNITY